MEGTGRSLPFSVGEEWVSKFFSSGIAGSLVTSASVACVLSLPSTDGVISPAKLSLFVLSVGVSFVADSKS